MYASFNEFKIALLRGTDDERAQAARALSRLFRDYPPPYALEDCLALLLEADKGCPGLADIFWNTVSHSPNRDVNLGKPWMLDVLRQRGPVQLRVLADGNTLLFHAHEFFDADYDVLVELVDLGFEHVVVMALDHGALTAEEDKKLCEKLLASGRHK